VGTILDMVNPRTEFASHLTEGDRTLVGMVGVDAGCVAIRRADGGSRHFRTGWSTQSSSGYGDGGYDVVTVSRHNQVTGIEVVFICEEAHDRAQEAVVAAGLESLTYPGPDASDEDRTVWAEADARSSAIHNDTFVAHLLVSSPTGDAIVGDTFEHDGGTVEITDPYVGHTGPVLDCLPAGTYTAVCWEADLGGWGRRCTRLGVYRNDAPV
jgi:hypothetical protein